jgi:hypothetical protein
LHSVILQRKQWSMLETSLPNKSQIRLRCLSKSGYIAWTFSISTKNSRSKGSSKLSSYLYLRILVNFKSMASPNKTKALEFGKCWPAMMKPRRTSSTCPSMA